MRTLSKRALLAVAATCVLTTAVARAEIIPLADWQLGNATEDVDGDANTSVSGTGSTATLNDTDGAISERVVTFAPFTTSRTMSVGETMSLSFDMTIQSSNGITTNDFRFGLFNHNDQPADSSVNWLGYMAHNAGGAGGTGLILARDDGASDELFFSINGSTALAKTDAALPGVNMISGTYSTNFELTLLSATEMNVAISMVSGDAGYTWEAVINSPHDPVGVNGESLITFDRVGFALTNGAVAVLEPLGTGDAMVQFSDVTVTIVPEPSAGALAALGLIGLGLVSLKKRANR